MKKAIFFLVVLAALGFLGWQIYEKIQAKRKTGGQKRPGAGAVAVEIAPIRRTAIADTGLFTGSLLPNTQFIVSPKIGGRVGGITVNVGDGVVNDQLIAVLDDDEYVQQVDQARAELLVAKANVVECRSALETAQREQDRVVALRQKKIASDSELDTAQAQLTACEVKYKVAEAKVTQAKAALRVADVRLSYCKVKASWEKDAPVEGKPGKARGEDQEKRVIGVRYVDEGVTLRANDPIVSVLDIDPLIGEIFVIERDYPKVRVGLKAKITTDAFPGKTFAGEVVRIAPLVRESSRQARVELGVPNAEQKLRPGMFIRARIQFSMHENATVVPFASLVKRNGKDGVFTADLKTMTAKFVPVTVGIVDEQLVEITSPALSGHVVVMGQHMLGQTGSIVVPDMEKKESPGKGGEAEVGGQRTDGGKKS